MMANIRLLKIGLVLFLASLVLMPFLAKKMVASVALGTVVEVEPYQSNAKVGETISVNVTVVDVQNLYGVEIDLYWNATILQLANSDIRLGVESHPDGVLHENFFRTTQEGQGKYMLSGSSINPAPSFNGSGNIVGLIFNVTNYGNSSLHLESQLYDYPPPDRDPRISWPIDHTTIDGILVVIPEFPKAVMLLLFMTLEICIIILLRKTIPKVLSLTI